MKRELTLVIVASISAIVVGRYFVPRSVEARVGQSTEPGDSKENSHNDTSTRDSVTARLELGQTAEQQGMVNELTRIMIAEVERTHGSLDAWISDEQYRFAQPIERVHTSIVLDELLRVGGQIALFRIKNSGQLPWESSADVQRLQWGPLVNTGYIGEPPINPLSPPEAATLIEACNTKGLDGANFDPAQRGWIWSLDEHQLLAAGFGDDEFDVGVQPTLDELPLLQHRLNLAVFEFNRLVGRWPLDTVQPWKPLIANGLIEGVPVNPRCPEGIGEIMIFTRDPRVDGAAVSVTRAGWVWNETHGMLHAVIGE